jgi:hypothetical protein
VADDGGAVMAGRRCTVCMHPDKPAIDQAMVNRRPFRDIARHFGVGKDAAVRHHDACLPEMLTRAKAASETAQADDLLAQVKGLRGKALALLLKAEQSGDLRTALRGVAEARACVELLAEMMQAIDRRPVVNVLISQEWLLVRSTLLDVLRPYPDAREAVAARLVALEAS